MRAPDPSSVALPQSTHSGRAPRRERLLLVGITSCDRPTAERLIAAGRMPNLARLRTEGAWGTLRAEQPLHAPSLWATIATGRHPEIHGMLASAMPRPDGGGVAPAGRECWRAPAMWQALEAGGRRTLTIGWPATWPATAWPGTHIDAGFALPTGPRFADWAIPPRSVSPLALRERLRPLRVHPTDITGTTLAPFVPRLAEVDQYREPRLAELAVMLATTATTHAAATALIETEAWDMAAVHYSLLDDAQRRFRRGRPRHDLGRSG